MSGQWANAVGAIAGIRGNYVRPAQVDSADLGSWSEKPDMVAAISLIGRMLGHGEIKDKCFDECV